jgi:hypothetical protein
MHIDSVELNEESNIETGHKRWYIWDAVKRQPLGAHYSHKARAMEDANLYNVVDQEIHTTARFRFRVSPYVEHGFEVHP